MAGVLGLWHYFAFIMLLMVGLYMVIARDNLVKKMMGLNIFQVAVIMFYVSLGKVDGGTAPIYAVMPHHPASEVEGHEATGGHETSEQAVPVFSNPVPHVLMLTAIVVGVATTALGLSLVIRIRESFGTAEEDEIIAIIAAEDLAQEAG